MERLARVATLLLVVVEAPEVDLDREDQPAIADKYMEEATAEHFQPSLARRQDNVAIWQVVP